MLKWNETKLTEAGKWYCTGCCLAEDLKPTAGLANGSQLVEMDTSKLFFFDEQNARWREFGGAA